MMIIGMICGMNTTQGVCKKFDKNLHTEYDSFGREIVKNFIEKEFKLKALDNPDKYGVDLIIYHNSDVVGYAEVEVRNSWKDDVFPFSDLNIPYRKKKLFDNPLPTLFFSVNKKGSALLYCGSMVILSCEVKELYNKYVEKGELFFKVPLGMLKYSLVN